MSTLDDSLVKSFQQKILTWFTKHKRDLPWRQSRDPYRILVSEIMLQQTQVSRVIPKYEVWLEKFPTLDALAQAKTVDVLALWSGLGYNRRALYLQRLAQMIVKNPHPTPLPKGEGTKSDVTSLSLGERAGVRAQLPSSVEALQKLPGIGSYTARAVACFAFDQQIAMVDTNIRKVIAVEFFNGNPPDAKTTQAVADQLLPHGKAYEWNQALMDYSSAMLKGEKIPIPKQSKFSGSIRFYRGQIVKLLIHHQKLSQQMIAESLASHQMDSNVLDSILRGLMKDKLIVQDREYFRLP